jgi:hypothetical protein
VGYFGQFIFSGGSWGAAAATKPYLSIDINDSDIATIDYAPASGGAMGRCYIGFEPRHYYENDSESDPVDTVAEAHGLADWARAVTGAAVDPSEVQAMLASPDGDQPENVFVEETLARLLPALGLPVPKDLPVE